MNKESTTLEGFVRTVGSSEQSVAKVGSSRRLGGGGAGAGPLLEGRGEFASEIVLFVAIDLRHRGAQAVQNVPRLLEVDSRHQLADLPFQLLHIHL